MDNYPLPMERLCDKIGYTFCDISLLETALTHSSFANETRVKGIDTPFNERLEFLGDSVLSIIVSDYLYRSYPNLPEGDLTRIRASAKGLDLGSYLRLGHGEATRGGRERVSILADAFEAILAAIYLDSGSKETVAKFLLPLVTPEINGFIEKGENRDYKTLLQQIVQQEKGEILEYVLIEESGPAHDKRFTVEAHLNSNVIGHGAGKSKREAEQLAAKEALVLFGDK